MKTEEELEAMLEQIKREQQEIMALLAQLLEQQKPQG